jgi:transposase
MINTNALRDDVRQYISNLESENKTYQTKIIDFEEKKKEYEEKQRQHEEQEKKYEEQQKEYEEKEKEHEVQQKESKETIDLQAKEIIRLSEELKLALFRKFGRLAEKFFDKCQLNLFESQENAASDIEADPESTTETERESGNVPPRPPKPDRGRKPIDPSIPREEIIIDIPEEEKQCACGSTLVCIGEEIIERLVIIPEQIFVLRYVVKKYACHECEGSGDEDKPAVRTGKVPANIIPGSIATPSLLASVFIKKYCDMVPFYRQSAAFDRIGIKLSRQNMSNWQQGTTEKSQPVLNLMKEHLKTGSVMRMDETTMQVMNESDRANTTKSYMWLARGGQPDKPAVLNVRMLRTNVNRRISSYSCS